jgi:predicted NBD/HSP70 family sugar kinase
MARQKKCYNSSAVNENRYIPANGNGNAHQSRGGGMTVRKNKPHRYATQTVETVASPTWLAARAAKKMAV